MERIPHKLDKKACGLLRGPGSAGGLHCLPSVVSCKNLFESRSFAGSAAPVVPGPCRIACRQGCGARISQEKKRPARAMEERWGAGKTQQWSSHWGGPGKRWGSSENRGRTKDGDQPPDLYGCGKNKRRSLLDPVPGVAPAVEVFCACRRTGRTMARVSRRWHPSMAGSELRLRALGLAQRGGHGQRFGFPLFGAGRGCAPAGAATAARGEAWHQPSTKKRIRLAATLFRSGS